MGPDGKPRPTSLKRQDDWGVPVLSYYEGDTTITHTQVIRMHQPVAEDKIFETCQTKVPGIVCECGRFILVKVKGKR